MSEPVGNTNYVNRTPVQTTHEPASMLTGTLRVLHASLPKALDHASVHIDNVLGFGDAVANSFPLN